MYYTKDSDQISLDEFFLPFGGHLRKDHRWVRFAAIMPWEHIEEIYRKSMSQETGHRAYSAWIAFGSNYLVFQ